LSFIVDLVMETHYVLATAHCQGHCAKVSLSTFAPHTHI